MIYRYDNINKSIIYDGSLYYKSKHLPPTYDKRGYQTQLSNRK